MTERSQWDGSRAPGYDAKWKRMAASGQNPHGEVDFVQRYAPTTALDAGCGTGRVAIELAARGVDVVGSDIDGQMLAEAKAKAPELSWVQADLASLDLQRQFDVVVMAGNIILFVAPGTESACVAGAARHVASRGYLLEGLSLRDVTADEWDGWLRNAGLAPEARFSTWDGDPFTHGDNYLVSVATRL